MRRWAAVALGGILWAMAAGCSDPATPTDAYLNYEFWALDCNGDERLSFEELRLLTWNRALEGVETPLQMAEFGGADADGDERLTIAEYTTLINKDGHYHYSPHPNCRAGAAPAGL